jgi:predicted MFS family arabinose efflux permease
VVAAFALVGAATQMAWLTFAPVTTVAAERYGVSEADVGWLANIFVLAFVLLAIPAGMALDRHLRTTLAAGAVLTAVGACLRLGGDSFGWMLLGGCVAALGQPIVLTGITGLTHGYLAPEHRPLGIALATASTWAGFVAAFALTAVLSTVGSLPTLVAVHAGYAATVAVVFVVALRRPPVFAEPEGRADALTRRGELSRALADPMLRKLCLVAFLPFGTFVALSTWTQALLEPAGVSVDQVGVILISCVLAGVLGTAVLPVWAARRRLEVLAGAVGILATAAVCVVLALAPGFGTALVGLTVTGLVLLPMLAIVLELVERHSGNTEGVASGLVWTAGNLGGLVVTGLVGLALDSPATAFLMLGAVTMLALPLLARLRGPVAAMPRPESVASSETGRRDGPVTRYGAAEGAGRDG